MAMVKQHFTIEKKQMETLREYCEQSGFKMSTIIRKGLDLYFKQIEKEANRNEHGGTT